MLKASGLRYADDVLHNPATEEIAIQLIGDTQLSVHRAVVETERILDAFVDPEVGVAPVAIAGVLTGFARDDGRSWINFHDGVSNLVSQDRAKVIVVKAETAPEPDDAWTIGGTYVAYLRLALDLPAWRKLTRAQQELLVGRDKLTGSPVTSLGPNGEIVTDARCPVVGTTEVIEPGNERFREPQPVGNPAVAQSHVQRANHHQGNVSDSDSLRLFRQGYEFFELSSELTRPRVGLNFVSFQDTPQRLLRLLTQQGWLGEVNFGGDPNAQPPGLASLLSVRAAAIFFVPPVIDANTYPGAEIFT